MHDRWEHFDDGADIGVRGFGSTLAAAFEQAALAPSAVVDATAAAGLARKVAWLEPRVCIRG